MAVSKKKGYGWAVSAGLNAAFAAISAKFITPQVPSSYHFCSFPIGTLIQKISKLIEF
ncbi:hypothetical protein Hanom_Chr02g00122921 [Helianthus anomalus]